MQPSWIAPFFTFAVVITANLLQRQSQCPEDGCYRAVWGTARGTDHPLTAQRDCMSRLITTVAFYPISTITVVTYDTSITNGPCSTIPSSSTGSPSAGTPLPGFPFPTPTPLPTGLSVEKIKARQNQALSTSSTTIIAPIPTYIGDNCADQDSVYASACGCKGVTSSVLSKLSTTLTSTDTLTLTSTITSAAACSSSVILTFSHSSSTSVTTFTFSSSAATGTGTASSISSTLSTDSSSFPASSSSPTLSRPGDSTSSPTDSTLEPTMDSTLSPTETPTVFPSLTSSSSSLNTTATLSATFSTRPPWLNTTSTSSTRYPTATPICPTVGTILCNGTCLFATSDRRNCGACGNVCANGLSCVNGVCAREPCDSTCEFDRLCNSGPNNSRGGCICATDASKHGICFDKDRYQCGNRNLTRCLQTELSSDPSILGCPLGEVCIKSICASNCNSTGIPESAQLGICVSTAGCERSGVFGLGPLVKVAEHEKRRRMVAEFNW